MAALKARLAQKRNLRNIHDTNKGKITNGACIERDCGDINQTPVSDSNVNKSKKVKMTKKRSSSFEGVKQANDQVSKDNDMSHKEVNNTEIKIGEKQTSHSEDTRPTDNRQGQSHENELEEESGNAEVKGKKKKKKRSGFIEIQSLMESNNNDKFKETIKNKNEASIKVKKKNRKRKNELENGTVDIEDIRRTKLSLDELIENKGGNINTVEISSENSKISAEPVKSEKDGDKSNEENNYFPVLYKHKHVKLTAVKAPQPKWLTEKNIISADVSSNKTSLQNINYLHDNTKNNLTKKHIKDLFPVQATVIPYVLNDHARILNKKFHPHDICVQAPTGSGKTLAYVLPIIELLSHFTVRKLYCLVVLPSKDLALQVKHVFDQYIQGTDIKVTLLSGVATFPKERERLVEKM